MDERELEEKLRSEGVLTGGNKGISMSDASWIPGEIRLIGKDEDTPDVITDEPLFDWNTAPISQCEAALAVIKLDYENALRILSARKLSESQPKMYTCWSQQHAADTFESDGQRVVPDSVLAKCKRVMHPGRWAYADYGAKDEHGNTYTATICSQLCYQVYSRYKGRQRNPSSRLVVIKE